MTTPLFTPWPLMLSYAAQHFHIMPDHFWRLSLREWRWLLHAPHNETLSREDLLALQSLFPDEV